MLRGFVFSYYGVGDVLCIIEIGSNRAKNKLKLKDTRGEFKETAARVCFQKNYFRSYIILYSRGLYSRGKAGYSCG